MKVFSTEEISDIQASYRDAANQRNQIGILADLYAVTRADICGVLGIEDPAPSGKRPYKPRASYEQSVKDDVVRAVLLEHLPYKEVAERFGVPLGNVNKWVSKAKKKQAEFLSYDPKSNDKSNESVAKNQKSVTEHRTLAPSGLNPAKIAEELSDGVEGLRVFLDSFAGIDIFEHDQLTVLDIVLIKAEGFIAGMNTAVELMEVGRQ